MSVLRRLAYFCIKYANECGAKNPAGDGAPRWLGLVVGTSRPVMDYDHAVRPNAVVVLQGLVGASLKTTPSAPSHKP